MSLWRGAFEELESIWWLKRRRVAALGRLLTLSWKLPFYHFTPRSVLSSRITNNVVTALLCKSLLNYSSSARWADSAAARADSTAGGREGRPALAQLGLGPGQRFRPCASQPNLQNEAHNCAASQGPENRSKIAPFLAQSKQLMNDDYFLLFDILLG